MFKPVKSYFPSCTKSSNTFYLFPFGVQTTKAMECMTQCSQFICKWYKYLVRRPINETSLIYCLSSQSLTFYVLWWGNISSKVLRFLPEILNTWLWYVATVVLDSSISHYPRKESFIAVVRAIQPIGKRGTHFLN